MAIVRGMIADGVLLHHRRRDLWGAPHHGPHRPRKSFAACTQAFAFPNGQLADRGHRPAPPLRAAMRMLLGYRGAFMRKMNGMGDIVFAPFYRVLKTAGRFKFFHRVKGCISRTTTRRSSAKSLGRQLA
jgi:hypothetical protein